MVSPDRSDLRNYLVVTLGYWAFTITDGAIRMLVVLYFHQLGYSPLEIALLFVFYEFFGVVTNLVGGWVGARIGLNVTMHLGMALQVFALAMLAVPEAWLSVAYVMFAQALSGIAKDLNKMSAKASVKLLVPDSSDGRLFRWVALLTGSKNALKGAGYFIGGVLLAWVGFQAALWILSGSLLAVLVVTVILLPRRLGRSKAKAKFSTLLSKTPAINWLSAARYFLFGSRDVWFVVGLPVFLSEALGWSHTLVGTFLALWIIAYGLVQASAPRLLRGGGHSPDGATARTWVFVLSAIPVAIAVLMMRGVDPSVVLVVGLAVYGVIFAINSAVHSFLILDYSDHDKVAMNVGFYYMANAGGRLTGTILSGAAYQAWGLIGCLWMSAAFLLAAGLFSLKLPVRVQV